MNPTGASRLQQPIRGGIGGFAHLPYAGSHAAPGMGLSYWPDDPTEVGASTVAESRMPNRPNRVNGIRYGSLPKAQTHKKKYDEREPHRHCDENLLLRVCRYLSPRIRLLIAHKSSTVLFGGRSRRSIRARQQSSGDETYEGNRQPSPVVQRD